MRAGARIAWVAAATLAALAFVVVACDSPPEPAMPSSAFATPAAHPSPDPPPARPLSLEVHDAASADPTDAGLDAATDAPTPLFQLQH